MSHAEAQRKRKGDRFFISRRGAEAQRKRTGRSHFNKKLAIA
ncbi:MAG: hypothetical protein RMY29_003325 [Nostoc sp. CreGUA01]|nr:hypothetical protein [Nostoc sp. CreGUA01]